MEDQQKFAFKRVLRFKKINSQKQIEKIDQKQLQCEQKQCQRQNSQKKRSASKRFAKYLCRSNVSQNKNQQQIKYNVFQLTGEEFQRYQKINKIVPQMAMQNDLLKDKIVKLVNQYDQLKKMYSYLDRKATVVDSSQKSFDSSDQEIRSNSLIQNSKKYFKSQRQLKFGNIDKKQDIQNQQSLSIQKNINKNQRKNRFLEELGQNKVNKNPIKQKLKNPLRDQIVHLKKDNLKLINKVIELEKANKLLSDQKQQFKKQNQKIKDINHFLEKMLKEQKDQIQKKLLDQALLFNHHRLLLQQTISKLNKQLKNNQINRNKCLNTSFSASTQIQSIRQLNGFDSYNSKSISPILADRSSDSIQKTLFKTNNVIDHLWEVKQIQYQNILKIIKNTTATQQQKPKQKLKIVSNQFK